jgi:hypothetical protein
MGVFFFSVLEIPWNEACDSRVDSEEENLHEGKENK